MVARTERSPGFGPVERLPGIAPQWLVVDGVYLPVTVAGPRRYLTGLPSGSARWSTYVGPTLGRRARRRKWRAPISARPLRAR